MLRGLALSALVGPVLGAQLGDCDPIDPANCMFPFPNDFWMREQPDGKVGIQFSPEGLPRDNLDTTIDPVAGGWNDNDGFSTLSPLLTYMDNVDLDRSEAARYWDIEKSLDSHAPIVILDAETGERIAHFTELDHYSGDDVSQTTMIWPAHQLRWSTRYIIGIRNMVDTEGTALAPSTPFGALRDNTPTEDPDVELRRGHFDEIFGHLEDAGVARSSLQLAWDFTTASQASITSKALFMRDDAFARVDAAGGFDYEIVSVAEDPDANIARLITVNIMVPQYVDSDSPPTTLVLDEQGMPVYQRLAPIEITVQVPNSVVSGEAVPSFLQYGHGLLGSKSQATGGWLRSQAASYGYIITANDWTGMSDDDTSHIVEMMTTDLSNFKILPDRCQQGFLHFLATIKFLKEGPFLEDPVMLFGGRQVVTRDAVPYYYGVSQGGILGVPLMALSTEMTRAVFGVPGGPYAMLLPRSVDFDPFGVIIKTRYQDPLDRAFIFNFLQMLWDRADPGGYMDAVTTQPLPNTPQHEVILRNALGDTQVHHLGTYFMARAMGAEVFESVVMEPDEILWGFPPPLSDSSTGKGSLMMSYSYEGVPPVPRQNTPPQGPDPHGWPRREVSATTQMYEFFSTGRISNTCSGACHFPIPLMNATAEMSEEQSARDHFHRMAHNAAQRLREKN